MARFPKIPKVPEPGQRLISGFCLPAVQALHETVEAITPAPKPPMSNSSLRLQKQPSSEFHNDTPSRQPEKTKGGHDAQLADVNTVVDAADVLLDRRSSSSNPVTAIDTSIAEDDGDFSSSYCKRIKYKNVTSSEDVDEASHHHLSLLRAADSIGS